MDIAPINVSFTCPECKTRNHHVLSLMEGKWSNKHAGVLAWCRCKRCERVTEVTYRLQRSRQGQIKFKLFKCMFGGKKIKNKRFTIEPNA